MLMSPLSEIARFRDEGPSNTVAALHKIMIGLGNSGSDENKFWNLSTLSSL